MLGFSGLGLLETRAQPPHTRPLSLPCLSLQPCERGALRVRTASGEMPLEDWAVVGNEEILVWPRASLKMQQVFGRAVGLPGAICWHQVPLSLTCPHGLLGAICRVRGGPDSLRALPVPPLIPPNYPKSPGGSSSCSSPPSSKPFGPLGLLG